MNSQEMLARGATYMAISQKTNSSFTVESCQDPPVNQTTTASEVLQRWKAQEDKFSADDSQVRELSQLRYEIETYCFEIKNDSNKKFSSSLSGDVLTNLQIYVQDNFKKLT